MTDSQKRLFEGCLLQAAQQRQSASNMGKHIGCSDKLGWQVCHGYIGSVSDSHRSDSPKQADAAAHPNIYNGVLARKRLVKRLGCLRQVQDNLFWHLQDILPILTDSLTMYSVAQSYGPAVPVVCCMSRQLS